MNYAELEEWADAIECRDDIDFNTNDLMEIVFILANPSLHQPINDEKIIEWISILNKNISSSQ